ncbi:hypothetical protein DFQ14_10262 [Halopolyspora algeriensis]|uniref:Uncharacterized protein n=1 Tax=Halopolyspora algeriensis TaxID=1500506 RepID=A0A368VZJ0_9ACTN|nr:hypothetical protein DFQ14_10262 [Halopolyspora algeriensis]TQM54145.1 hypothetical protein FHU43_2324 [Halopolyspora algeriensis]
MKVLWLSAHPVLRDHLVPGQTGSGVHVKRGETR